MKLKIISDGKPWGTRLVDKDTGDPLENVKSFVVVATAGELNTVYIEVLMPEIDMIADAYVSDPESVTVTQLFDVINQKLEGRK